MSDVYQAPKSSLDEVIRYSGEPVGFWKRFVAWMADSFLTQAITLTIGYFVYGQIYLDERDVIHGNVDIAISFAIPILGTILFWRYCLATPGKMLFQAVIVDYETRQAPQNWQLVVRFLGYIVSALPLAIGYLWAAGHPEKRAWHDLLSRTIVVKKYSSGALRSTPPGA